MELAGKDVKTISVNIINMLKDINKNEYADENTEYIYLKRTK